MSDLAILIQLFRFVLKDRTQLTLENIALRHQLAVCKPSMKRPNSKDGDRIFWLTVVRMLKEWREACDSLVVPTVTFQRLFCFVMMSLARHRILHVNVTKHPTAGRRSSSSRHSPAMDGSLGFCNVIATASTAGPFGTR